MPFLRARSSSWLSTLCVLSLTVVHRSAGFTTNPSFSRRSKRQKAWTTTSTSDATQSFSPIILSSSAPKGNPSEQQNNDNNSVEANPFVKWLAELSLEDYQWRSNIFKSNQADRMVEESIARMRGENATYVRPMDATGDALGPLGRLEMDSVSWLSQVIEEEARRAKKIVESTGKLIRPADNLEGEKLGPLGFLEKQIVEFFAKIRRAETERFRTKTLRPKDLDESFRGPLGQLELQAVRIFEEIRSSEKLRAQQSRNRGGEIVRPIDVPGPLGELELKVAEIFRAEVSRAAERARNAGQIVRPKDAAVKGPLGKAETSAYETIQSLSNEEMERLRNIRRTLEDNRPMENNRDSLLGVAEAVLVGILRAPTLLINVVSRVTELLQSKGLDDADREVLRQQQDKAASEKSSNPGDTNH